MCRAASMPKAGTFSIGRWCIAAAIAPMLLAPPPLRAFSSLVIFGDSLSDVGNVSDQTFGLAPGSPYYQGRYSNGPLWVEALASQQGLPAPKHSRDEGSDWAYAGTKTGSGSTNYFLFFSFPNLGTQINSYLNGRTPSADQLFVVWGGGNDFIGGQTNVSIPVNNVVNHVTTLANAGARSFVVPNLPPLGQLPRFKGTGNEATMDQRSGSFNTQLAGSLTALETSLNIQIYQLDVAGLFAGMLGNPSSYGFTNTTQPALDDSTVSPNPDEYVFWDDIHPTRVSHALLGTAASDLLDTHTWTAGVPVSEWSSPASWDPPAVPQARWICELINTSPAGKIAAVSAASSVRKVRIDGTSQKMTLAIESGATLSTAELEMGSNAEIGIELAGSGQHGRLEVSGPAKLNGAIAVSLAVGFTSLPGSTFEVLSFGSRIGELDVINQTGFAGLRFDDSYSAGQLTLTATATGGDANLDGVVDISDLGLLATSWQTAGNWLAGDFDASGFVDISDLGLLATNWQLGAMPALGLPAAAVPEPALFGMAALLAIFRTPRR